MLAPLVSGVAIRPDATLFVSFALFVSLGHKIPPSAPLRKTWRDGYLRSLLRLRHPVNEIIHQCPALSGMFSAKTVLPRPQAKEAESVQS
jgi:hypothetical protein